MGYIYKITNTINSKVYIGQTIKTAEKRFQQHRNNYTKSYFSQIVLYKAFKKYGIENFSFEIIEEIPNEELDLREKYWIEQYDSYNNGYNSTLGGRDVELYKFDEEEIIEEYHILKSARQVAKKYNIDHNTIDRILNANHVKRYSQGNRIKITKGEEIHEFNSTRACARFFIEQGISKAKKARTLAGGLNGKLRKSNPCLYKDWVLEKII